MKEYVWLTAQDVISIHVSVLATHGGLPGLRDRGLLESAVARPQQMLAYGSGLATAHLAAAYTTAIVRNHPFLDGNKRAGFVAGVVFLEVNGYQFVASEEEAAAAVVALASRSWEESDYVMFLIENSERLSP